MKPAVTAPAKKQNDDLDFDFDDFDDSVKKEDINPPPKSKESVTNNASNKNNTSKKSLNDGYDEDFEIEEDFDSPPKEDKKVKEKKVDEDEYDYDNFDFEDSNKKEDDT